MDDFRNEAARPEAILGDRRITLEHLRAFVAVSDNGGFQRAGEELARSQSAITQSLKRLEDILCRTLVARDHGRYTGLTADGRRFIGPARDILSRLDDAVGAVRRPNGADKITLGVPDDFRIENLRSIISRSFANRSTLRVEVVSALSEELKERFSKGSLDVVLYKDTAEATPFGCDCKMRVVHEELLRWVARERFRVDPSRELPLVTFPEGCAYRRAALQSLETTGIRYSIAYSSASYENVRSAISAGLGVGLLPMSAAGPDHAIMPGDAGFPAMQNVRLVLATRRGAAQFDKFADALQKALTA